MGITPISWDQGLGIRQNNTEPTWVVKYRLDGVQRVATLAPVALLSENEARALARKARYEAKCGKDPYPRKQSQNGNPKSPLFSLLCKRFIEEYAKEHKLSWKKDQDRINCYLIPAFGKLRLEEITKFKVSEFHAALGKRTIYGANRSVEQLSKMFNWAQEQKLVPEGVNPARGIKKFKEKARDRWLSPTEADRLLAIIDQVPDQQVQVLLKLYLLTCCRRTDLLTLKWRYVDLSKGTAYLPRTKSGEPRCVPLPPTAVALLSSLPQDNEYVFPGRFRDKPRKEFRNQWDWIRQEANLPDVHVHDLRHTGASWLAQKDKSLLLLAEVLGQTTIYVTRKYAHFAQQHVRDLLLVLDELAQEAGCHA